MKKFFYFTTFVLFLVLIIFIDNTSYGFAYGDVDFDGKVTANDSRLILRASTDLETLNSTQKNLADINRDGQINSADARLALRTSVGSEKIKIDCTAR